MGYMQFVLPVLIGLVCSQHIWGGTLNRLDPLNDFESLQHVSQPPPPAPGEHPFPQPPAAKEKQAAEDEDEFLETDVPEPAPSVCAAGGLLLIGIYRVRWSGKHRGRLPR